MAITKDHCDYKKTKILFMALLAITLLSFGCVRQKPQIIPNSLYELLNDYGFQTSKEKEALQFLMRRSGILKSNESIKEKFPARTSQNDLFKDALTFVQLTQQYFTQRTGTEERWEVNPSEWMQQNKPEILEALNTLGFIKAITPKHVKTDVICILGSTFKSMLNRLKFAAYLYDNKVIEAKQLVLLAGQRRVIIGIDGTESELDLIAKKYAVPISALTETQLIKEAYIHSALFDKLPVHVIDTPAGKLPRPTTETSMGAFCQWLKIHPEIRTVTFISNQPHVKYQRAVIREVLRQQAQTVQFQVIGPKASPSVEIQDLIGALGSQIWAETPYVLTSIRLTPTDPVLRKELLELYVKQPLIYKNIKSLLK